MAEAEEGRALESLQPPVPNPDPLRVRHRIRGQVAPASRRRVAVDPIHPRRGQFSRRRRAPPCEHHIHERLAGALPPKVRHEHRVHFVQPRHALGRPHIKDDDDGHAPRPGRRGNGGDHGVLVPREVHPSPVRALRLVNSIRPDHHHHRVHVRSPRGPRRGAQPPRATPRPAPSQRMESESDCAKNGPGDYAKEKTP